MSKKYVLNPNIIQKFKWGGTNLEWEEEAEKLSNQIETIEFINNMAEENEAKNEKS
ncbi:MAG: hypothetical protein ACOZCL_05560 [Bacillota bacterium]